LILIDCNFFLRLHFVTSLNNRRQLNDNDFTTQFLLLSSFKNFSWKLRAYYGYAYYGLRENISNLNNLRMLFMLWIKYKFSECLPPAQTWSPQWKTFWRRFYPGPQTRAALGSSSLKSFLCPPDFVPLRKICFKHM